MNRQFPGPKKALNNLAYIQNMEQRKMSRILDALQQPIGSSNQTQAQEPPRGALNPVTAFYLPWFDRALTQYLATCNESKDAVRKAKEFVDEAFAAIGFRFVAPLGFEVVTPAGTETQQDE